MEGGRSDQPQNRRRMDPEEERTGTRSGRARARSGLSLSRSSLSWRASVSDAFLDRAARAQRYCSSCALLAWRPARARGRRRRRAGRDGAAATAGRGVSSRIVSEPEPPSVPEKTGPASWAAAAGWPRTPCSAASSGAGRGPGTGCNASGRATRSSRTDRAQHTRSLASPSRRFCRPCRRF